MPRVISKYENKKNDSVYLDISLFAIAQLESIACHLKILLKKNFIAVKCSKALVNNYQYLQKSNIYKDLTLNFLS